MLNKFNLPWSAAESERVLTRSDGSRLSTLGFVPVIVDADGQIIIEGLDQALAEFIVESVNAAHDGDGEQWSGVGQWVAAGYEWEQFEKISTDVPGSDAATARAAIEALLTEKTFNFKLWRAAGRPVATIDENGTLGPVHIEKDEEE
jgi:hypothetical protein